MGVNVQAGINSAPNTVNVEFSKKLQRFIRVRFSYVLILGFAGIMTQIADAGVTSTVVVDIATAIFTVGLNGGFWIWSKRAGSHRALAVAIIALDILIATFVIFTHGGIESRSVVLYVIPILSAGILYGRLWAYYIAVVCAAIYDIPLVLQWLEVLPRPGAIFPTLHEDGGYLLQTVIFYNAALAMVAMVANLSSKITGESQDQLSRQHDAILQAQDIAKVGSWEWDIKQNRIVWSDQLYSIFGITKAQLTPDYQSYLRLIHPEDRAKLDQVIRQSLKTRQPFRLTHRAVLPDGQVRYIQGEGQVLLNEQGDPVRMIGTAQDITEQAKIQIQLRARTAELEKTREAILNVLEDLEKEKKTIESERVKDEALLNSLGEGLILIDAEGKVVRANPQALELTGYTADGLLGQWFPKAVPVLDDKGKPVPPFERPVVQALSTGKIVSRVVQLVKVGGTAFPAFVTVSPFVVADAPAGAVVVFRDVTEEQKLEHAKEEFVSLASHQLRTPATGVKAFATMLADGYAGQLTDKQQEFIKKVVDSNERQLQIIDDMLNVARADAGRLILVKEEFDVNSMIDDIVVEQQSTIQSRKQKLTVNKPAGKLPLNADPKRYRMVVENILSNASKYTPEGGNIVVDVRSDFGKVIVKIKDSGVGIAKDDIPKLFTKFGRIDNPLSTKVGGTGLGLYLAKEIIDLHKGKLEVSSESGKGTEFTISVPLVSEKKEAPRLTGAVA